MNRLFFYDWKVMVSFIFYLLYMDLENEFCYFKIYFLSDGWLFGVFRLRKWFLKYLDWVWWKVGIYVIFLCDVLFEVLDFRLVLSFVELWFWSGYVDMKWCCDVIERRRLM